MPTIALISSDPRLREDMAAKLRTGGSFDLLAAGSIDELLFAGEEWVTRTADFNLCLVES